MEGEAGEDLIVDFSALRAPTASSLLVRRYTLYRHTVLHVRSRRHSRRRQEHLAPSAIRRHSHTTSRRFVDDAKDSVPGQGTSRYVRILIPMAFAIFILTETMKPRPRSSLSCQGLKTITKVYLPCRLAERQ